MSRFNYHHLQYFHAIAKSGSIARASEILHITPQTLSAQLGQLEERLGYQLFERRGKRLELNEMGRITFRYADEIFHLGDELISSLENHTAKISYRFTIGVTDVIDKVFSFNLLKEVYSMDQATKLICKETGLEALLAELAVNKVDAILSETPLPKGSPIKAYNHLLGESGFSFFASKEKGESLQKNFPLSLDKELFFSASEGSYQRLTLLAWFEQLMISPNIVGEFDDSALAKYFAQGGYGVFCAPTIAEAHILEQFDLCVVGRTKDISERFYLISTERRVNNPAVKQLMDKGKALFDQQITSIA